MRVYINGRLEEARTTVNAVRIAARLLGYAGGELRWSTRLACR